MCLYITGVVPIAPDRTDFRSVVETHRLLFAPIDNPHITLQLRPEERYFHVTRGMCDCSTTLGSLSDRTTKSYDLQKLRRRGWSDAKIRRWVQSKESHQLDPRPPTGELTRQQWAAFLQDALALKSVAYVGLLMHWYRHSTHDEQFVIDDRVPVVASLVVDGMDHWAENVLYEFRRDLASD